jgi:hypothetical protein
MGEKKDMRKLSIDVPANMAVIEDNSMEISGWVIADSPVERIVVFINGEEVCDAVYGLKREDVGNAFPQELNSGLSGYRAIADLYPVMGIGSNNLLTVKAITKKGSEFCEDKRFTYSLIG